MIDSFFGAWWLPESDHQQFGGILVIEDGRPSLNVVGSLIPVDLPQSGFLNLPLSEPLRAPVIHGRAVVLEPRQRSSRTTSSFTILNATCSFPVTAGMVGGTENWSAEAVLEGGHTWPMNGKSLFRGMAVQLHLLPAWAGHVGVQYELEYQAPFKMSAESQYRLLARATLAADEDCQIEQNPSFNTSWSHFEITQKVVFKVAEISSKSWRELLADYLQPLEGLLWLSSSDPSWIIEIKVLPSVLTESKEWYVLHAPMVQPAGDTPERDPSPDDLLFVASELPTNRVGEGSAGFELGYPHWLELWTRLHHIVGPLLSRSRAPFTYADDRLVTAAAALEALDKYSNKSKGNLALWKRVQRTIESCGKVGEALTGHRSELFAKQVVALRTVSAHATTSVKGLGDEPGGHYFAAAGISWLLRVLILTELGFDKTDVIKRITGHRRFRSDAAHLRAALEHLANPSSPYQRPRQGPIMSVGRATKLPDWAQSPTSFETNDSADGIETP